MFGTKILEERRSKYNGLLRVVKTFGMGVYIQSDGLTQSGGIVETIWRQTFRFLNHKLLIINRCLILGLGGGTAAKLINKKWINSQITAIEIDPVMVELGKKYLGLSGGIKIKIEDAIKFISLKSSVDNDYDLIIVDLYNGDRFPAEFGDVKILELIKSKLSNKGLVIFNRLYYGDKRPEAVKFGNKLEKIFSKVTWFYPEANVMFICSK